MWVSPFFSANVGVPFVNRVSLSRRPANVGGPFVFQQMWVSPLFLRPFVPPLCLLRARILNDHVRSHTAGIPEKSRQVVTENILSNRLHRAGKVRYPARSIINHAQSVQLANSFAAKVYVT